MREIEIPEKSQHTVDDFLVTKLKLKTDVDVFQRANRVYTNVRKNLFKRHSNIQIELTLEKTEPSEGVKAHTDAINERLKDSF